MFRNVCVENVKGKRGVLQGLRDMGYRLSDDELQRLMNAIGGNHDSVSRSTIMASQIDWRHLQVCGPFSSTSAQLLGVGCWRCSFFGILVLLQDGDDECFYTT